MSVTRQIGASPSDVYRALIDGAAVSRWRAPHRHGLPRCTPSIHGRAGAFRISLSYEDERRIGKTTDNVDTYHGYFRELVPDRRVVEVVEFETSDPDLRSEITITTSLESVGATDKATGQL